MVDARTSSKALGWIALALLSLAALAFVVPIALYALTSDERGFAVGDGPTQVEASGHRTWGIYLNDADNSGYSESCAITDSHGMDVPLRDPGWTMSSSETEMLDHLFTTPDDGRFTIDCSSQSADVRVAPAADLHSIMIGFAVATAAGLAGLVLGIIWLTRRSASPVG
jgi:hypothetical protein